MSENEQSTSGPVVTPARLIAAVCVIVPFIAVLWVPIYDKDKPEVAGFPFFFWWQLLWVAVTAGLMGLAYYVVRREELARKAVPAAAVASAAETSAAETSAAETNAAETNAAETNAAEASAAEASAEEPPGNASEDSSDSEEGDDE